MNSKNSIHFLAASDRINYGDFLFPIIFNNVIKEKDLKYKVNYYGIIKSDFSYFGGIPTKSYKKLHSNLKKDGGTVVIGGGDVFFGNWETLYSYISPLFVKLYKYKLIRKISVRLNILDYVLHKKNVMLPFTPAGFEFETIKPIQVVYNAVGGTFNSLENKRFNSKIVERLKSSTYISVRDKRTKCSLKKFKINSILTPDSAVIMSDFYPLEDLKKRTTLKTSLADEKIFFCAIRS